MIMLIMSIRMMVVLMTMMIMNMMMMCRDPHYNIPPLHPSNLSVLNSVREITGFLLIQSDDKDFVDLSFLSNLEVIHGRQLE